MSYKNIIYRKLDRIARITLNRPRVMNAFNGQMWSELNGCMDDAEADTKIAVIILAGAGPCFSSGADIYERLPEIEEGVEPELVRHKIRRHWKSLWAVNKPIITQVHGYCLGLGCELVMFSDLSIASEDATFGEPEGKMGLPTPTLLWMAGTKKGMEMLLLGELINANEAYRIGIINKVVPKDKLEEEVDRIAQTLADSSASAVSATKRMAHRLYQILGYDLADDIAVDFGAYISSLSSLSDDDSGFWKVYKEKGVKEALKLLKGEKPKHDKLKP